MVSQLSPSPPSRVRSRPPAQYFPTFAGARRRSDARLTRSPPLLGSQVTAANAHKRRITADKKTASNVNKRGMVPDPAAERRMGKLSAGPLLLGFFFVVIVGSTLLEIISKGSRR